MHTWLEASARWLSEMSYKRDIRNDTDKLRWIDSHWSDLNLSDIDRITIDRLMAEKIATCKPATVNRYLALIRAILRRAAFDWEWINKPPRIHLMRESRRRLRWLTPEQARDLMNQLPEHQRLPMIFALSTGLRAGNVCGLTWSQIDLRRRVCWIFGDQTKNGEDLSISLNDNALSVLLALKQKGGNFVFTYQGKPIKRLTTRAWYKALARAGITDFRWHDLRHTWASWLVQAGVPLYAVQEMGGWQSATMVRRYAHLSPAYNLKNAEKIDSALDLVSGRLL